jgi:branched-chain amino acid aminotransferase
MYYSENTIVYLNGAWIKAKDAQSSLYGQTIHYGNGVFEGIRAYKTKNGTRIFKAKEHFERFLYSMQKMHIPNDYSIESMIDICYEVLEKNQLEDAYLRPLCYLEPNMSLVPVQKSHLFICAWEWGKYLGDKTLNICTSSFERPNPNSCYVDAKVVGHYTNSILATTEARAKGFDEALLLDMHQNVAEGPGANFFFEKDKVLYTPRLGNILPGITRSSILELGTVLNIKIIEKSFKIEEVYGADSAFFTGTAAEVIGIHALDNTPFKLDWSQSLGFQLAKAYQNLVLEEANLNAL